MQNFSNSKNYQNARIQTGSAQIPIGAYKCIVKSAKEETFDWGKRLAIAFDVTSGDYKGFFQTNYDQQKDEDKKWKGVLRQNEPKDDGTEQDGWTMSRFKTMVYNFEESNEGYAWDWDETKLKGKVIGILFRKHYTVIEGKDVCYHEAFLTLTIDDVESGNFKEPQDYYDKRWKEHHGSSSATGDSDFVSIDTSVDEEDIPF